MSEDFPKFSKQIRANFNLMCDEIKKNHDVYVVTAEPDTLWEHYISSFPDGSNEIFRERTEHDCSCCKNFIRYVAGMVQIIDGKVFTVWENCMFLPYPYNEVGNAMKEFVTSFAISNFYRTTQNSYGNQITLEAVNIGEKNGYVKEWHHFSATMPSGIVRTDVAEFQGEMTARAQVFARGLEELVPDAMETILELIKDKMLYRGDEHLKAVTEFYELLKKYKKLNSLSAKNIFVWEHVKHSNSRFRNTVIGTLATDLSDGLMDIQDAVKAFELKVAPLNYKRPKSLITNSMVKAAEKTLIELNMGDSIHRRFATISDINITDVLWADRITQTKMKSSFMLDLLASETIEKKDTPIPNKITEIFYEEFIRDVLPELSGLEVFVESRHIPNFVSLTAPQHESTKSLFMWNNNFAWSYEGNITDSSIQQRVKNAGGRVEGALMRVSLAWFNTDDLDIHVREPDGNIICYNNKCDKLDVDMNISGITASIDAVENVSWMKTPRDGIYSVIINNFTLRNQHMVGFDLEVESNGEIRTFNYPNFMPNKYSVIALNIVVKKGVIVSISTSDQKVVETNGPKGSENWGVKTKAFARVETVLNSPNHWDGQQIGNLHTFFILEDCFNPEPTRGIYNEFLSGALHKHRKVFEILGSKTKCPLPLNQNDQLSGLGFSSTKRMDITIKAKQDVMTHYFKLLF